MNAIRNFLNIPLRIIKLVALFLAIVFFCIAFFLFFALIDPIRWILTGKYTGFDERGDKMVEIANRIIDKLDFNTQNK